MTAKGLPNLGGILDNLVSTRGEAGPRRREIAPQRPDYVRPRGKSHPDGNGPSRANTGARRGRPMGSRTRDDVAKEKVSFRIPCRLVAEYRSWSWEARCSLSTLAERAMAEFLDQRASMQHRDGRAA